MAEKNSITPQPGHPGTASGAGNVPPGYPCRFINGKLLVNMFFHVTDNPVIGVIARAGLGGSRWFVRTGRDRKIPPVQVDHQLFQIMPD